MIHIKSSQDIARMREGGRKLFGVLRELLDISQPGVNLRDIDIRAGELIKASGAMPSFSTVKGYNWPTCLCVNDVVVHGIPTDRVLCDGDMLTIDVGLIFEGFHTDTAWTKIVGVDHSAERAAKENFLEVGQQALYSAIKLAMIGAHIGDISLSTQNIIEGHGYSLVKSLVGHGVGRELHEDPQVPNYSRGDAKNTYQFRGGETIAIEPIYVMGKGAVIYDNADGWTISTKDRSWAAVFEHSIAITPDGPLVLTSA